MKIRLGVGVECLHLGGFNPSYQALLSQAQSLSYGLPSTTEQALQNKLVQDLIDNGIWSSLDQLYIFINNISSGGTNPGRDFATLNWISPTQNQATASNVLFPTWSVKNGFTGVPLNLAGLKLNAVANAGTNFKNPNGSFGFFGGTLSATNNSRIMGATGNSSTINRIRISGSSYISGAGGGLLTGITASNTMYHLNVNATESLLFTNGVAGTSRSTTWVADTQTWHLFRYGDVGAVSTDFGDSQIKIAFIGGDLSTQITGGGSTKSLKFYQLLNAYITAINNL